MLKFVFQEFERRCCWLKGIFDKIQYVKNELFGIVDISIGLAWFVLILFIAYLRRSRNNHLDYYRYFMPNVWFKLTFSLIFSMIYVLYYGGGDTSAYWEGGVTLNSLFWDSPSAFFQELFTTPSQDTIYERFNMHTGYPPIWIYREPESWFVCKIISFFTFFTFNSYLAITFIFSYFASLATWRLFELVQSFNFLSQRNAAFTTLFIPTVSIWCSGISKDTLILISICFMIYHMFGFFSKERKVGVYGYFIIIFYLFILYHLRPFMIIAIIPPLFIAFGAGILKRLGGSVVLIAVVRVIILFIGLGVVGLYFQAKGNLGVLEPEAYLEEAAIIQQDFAQNELYTGKRYDLDITEYTTVGMLKAMPAAVVAAFYRPFIWESDSLFLLLSGIESALLLWLTFLFFVSDGGLYSRIVQISKNEFLMFSILFALFFGFSVGFTAILFGVLVRFKAPILPFLAVVLLARNRKKKSG